MGCYSSKAIKSKSSDDSCYEFEYSKVKESPPSSEDGYHSQETASSPSTSQEMRSALGSGGRSECDAFYTPVGGSNSSSHSKKDLILKTSDYSSLYEMDMGICEPDELLKETEVPGDLEDSFYSGYSIGSRGTLAAEVAFMCMMPSVMPKTSSPLLARRLPKSDDQFAFFTTPSGSIASLVLGEDEYSYNLWIDNLELTPTYAHAQNISRIPEALAGQFTPKGFPVSYTNPTRLTKVNRRRERRRLATYV